MDSLLNLVLKAGKDSKAEQEYCDLIRERDALRQQVADLQNTKQVATVEVWNQGGSGEFTTANGIETLPHGTKLYATISPSETAH